MKLLFSVFLLIFSARAHASLKFSYSETPDYAKPQLIDILEVQTQLEERGYWPVDLSHEQRLQRSGVDQIFFDATNSKIVLLKLGQKVSDSNYVGQLINFEGDLLFHGETSGKVPFALYFIGHRELDARHVLKDFGVKKSVSLLRFFIPEAQAACSASTLAAAGALGMTMSSPLILQKLWNCGLAAGSGAKESVKGLAKGVKTFFSDPAKFWRDTKQAATQLWGFVSKIHIEVGKLVKLMGGLDAETAWQVGCTIAGKLLPSLVLGAVTGAAAAAAITRLLPLLSYQLQKVRLMSSVLHVLSRQREAGRLKNAEEAIERVVSCAQ